MQLFEDFIWLVLTVYLEAQGEGTEGRIMVAHSIMNRAEQKGKTIKEVVLQPDQYSCWNNFNYTNKMPAVSYTKDLISCYQDCLKAVGERMTGKTGEDVNHYFNPHKCNPSWAKEMILIADIGNHKFLYDPNY